MARSGKFFAEDDGGHAGSVMRGWAAALGAGWSVDAEPAQNGSRGTLKSRINDIDLAHLNGFPATTKAWVLEKIMSLTPIMSTTSREAHHYEKALMRLRDEGYHLIDLQPQETVFATVWYRKKHSLLSKREDVVMLLWDCGCAEDADGSDSTMVMSWRI